MAGSKAARLREKKDFERVYAEGKTIKNELIVMVVLEKEDSHQSRVGYAVSKRLGKATERNKIRRRLKEALRLSEVGLPDHSDTVLIARGKIRGKGYAEIEGALKSLLKRAQYLNK